MRRYLLSRRAENLFVRRATALALVLAVLLLAPSDGHADTWSGIGSDWFSSTSWSLGNNGPPTSAETASFPDSVSGIPLSVTGVQLSASTTINVLSVDSPLSKQYTFTGANGAVLTATQQMDFKNGDGQVLNVHTVSSLRLNSPVVVVRDNAILSLNNSTVTTNSIGTTADGRIDVNDGSSVQTVSYLFDQAAGELRVNSGGELRIAGDTVLIRGTTTINGGGQLNAASGVDLEYNAAALLQFLDSHTIDNGVHLKATGGGDITCGSFLDVGNGVTGSLTVDGVGSTLTSQSSVSDWGAGSAGNATVTVSNSGVATVSQLRAGTGSAVFAGTVSGGATLSTTSTFRMGGGSTNRTVSLTIDGGTLQTAGLATFDNQADMNLVSGTVNFNAGATFNAGSRFDWSGGVVNLGAGQTLLVDGGIVNRTSTSGFVFSNTTTTRIRNGGAFITPSYFDLGNATLDMNNGGLTVGTTGGTISDWGGNGATTTATLTNNAVATYNSGLRMGVLGSGGATNATISGGARLVSNESLITGGEAASNVTLNVTGGRVDSDGQINLLRGTTTTVSSAGVVEAQNVVLGSSGGTSNITVTGASSLLKARGTLTAGRTGTSTLFISAGGEAESAGPTIIGELAGASATVTVTGGGSRLDVGTTLTVGAGGAGRLNIDAGGFVPVLGGVAIGSAGTLSLSGSSSIETNVGQSIVNNGVVEAISSSQIRADVTNVGSLALIDSSITRGVTLQANSVMIVENATVGSLTQQAGADIRFGLISASDFGKLAVTGAASLSGDFVVSLDSSFAPTAGMEFPIFTAGSIAGGPNFDFSAAPLAGGLTWGVAFGPTSLGLVVISTSAPGDFDFDSDVDGADFLAWQRGGSPSPLSAGDLADWRANFGASGGLLTAASVAVPEPGAMVLAVAAAGGLAFCRRRLRR